MLNTVYLYLQAHIHVNVLDCPTYLLVHVPTVNTSRHTMYIMNGYC